MKKILKKSAAALAALTLTAALAGCGSSASSAAASTDTAASTAETSDENELEKVKAAGKLVIGVEGTYPPFTYHDDNGELTGLDVELGKALAEKVLEVLEDRPIQYTYPLEMPLKDKINAIATKIYRADGVNYSAAASKTLAELTEMGYGDLPVCIAKTQYSFSDNAKLTGAPTGFTMEVREVRLAAGAGFVVVICGSIMTMPGLPKKPAAVGIDVDADGKITGLF